MIRNKQEKAITLIALVVTIVVLLILAAISISALGGQDGIIKKGKQSKEETEISEEKEVIEISVAQAIQKDVYGNIVEENLEEALNKNIGPRDEKYQLESSKENFIVTILYFSLIAVK